MKIYYIVMVAGVPYDVSVDFARANLLCRELATANREAQVVPVVPLQGEFEFKSENEIQAKID